MYSPGIAVIKAIDLLKESINDTHDGMINHTIAIKCSHMLRTYIDFNRQKTYVNFTAAPELPCSWLTFS